MSEFLNHPVRAIAAKDLADARRDHFILIVIGFIALAALTSLVTGAIALANDVTTYNDAKATLMALGKSLDGIAAPEFYPLKLLRGAIEQIEIIGAVLGILAGFRAAVSERGRQTLALIMTRPVKSWQFLAGKYVSGVALLSLGLAAVFGLAAVTLQLTSGVGLQLADLGRIAIVWVTASAYVMVFYSLTFVLTLWAKSPANALLLSFALWLLVVLVAPQVGDTLDPDNQVAGGVFKQLHVPKAEQNRIKAGYAGFETIRNGIEAASVTKHFERFSFAVLGIKDSYTGKPLGPILVEKRGDFLWILFTSLGLAALMLARPINANRLTKE
ncbi:ABC transporter permease subunit [Mesobacterium sp. TK19101]|uniref:ABC transporter permease subunit n=1 Tax=Mesobacterium hydrothermale TaxID=3111907 RepID=A0ABU6HKW6_9RHOB|nr:ABC transporter permease subunit [Mesobacterium sp. TK19101]MEC3863100.1 ABC transporter permease subunit [Mesobacterium sp. TK19101]